MAAPNDGYLLLYLSYLRIAPHASYCVGGERTPTFRGHYDILSPWGLDYTLYIGGGIFHRGPPIGFPIEAYLDPAGK